MRRRVTEPESDSFDQISEAPSDEARHSVSIEQLVQQLKETADKLIRDQANRGDVKLLSTALKELRYAFKVFARYRGRRKSPCSARHACSRSTLRTRLQLSLESGSPPKDIWSSREPRAASWKRATVGAGRENSIGVNILLPFEQDANAIIAGDAKLMHLKYFFTRKLLFVKESDAVVLLPGGFGTQDEGFEVLTLVQTGKSHLFPIVMLEEPGGDYWRLWRGYVQDVLLARA